MGDVIFTMSLWWRWGTLVAGVTLTALVLAVGHWFPWVRRLTRIQAYVYGVVSIWLGFALWRVMNFDWQTPAGLVLISLVGGAVVVAAYRIDGVVLRVRQAHKAEGADGLLAE